MQQMYFLFIQVLYALPLPSLLINSIALSFLPAAIFLWSAEYITSQQSLQIPVKTPALDRPKLKESQHAVSAQN